MVEQTTLLYGADVRVLDEANARGDALAWRGGQLLAAGELADVERAAGPDARRIDAGGATVLPGFIDPHHHASIAALYGGLDRLVAPRVTDVASMQRALAHAAERVPAGEWLVVTEWDELKLAERRPPTRAELDDAVPDHPLFALHYSCHRALANSRALELAGIDATTPEPAGGQISRGRGGLPDGLLIERGMSRVESLARASLIARDAEGFFERLGRHHRALLEAGITYIADATVPGDMAELYREANRRGVLRVPTMMFPVSVTGYLEAPFDALEGPATGHSEGMLSVGPLKLVFDGAPACAMCLSWWQLAGTMVSTWALALRQGSLDVVRNTLSLQPQLGAKVRTGIHIYTSDEAREVVAAAVEHGFALATHAVGNAAVDVALAAYESQSARLDAAGVPRLEHATFVSEQQARRIADTGAFVVTQPHFLSMPAFGSAPSIPGMRTIGLRWLLDAGVRVAGSSDFPVAGFEPLDGIRSAVGRVTSAGHVHEGDQSVSLDEALAMYARRGAEACGCADERGSLEPGKRADFVLLDTKLSASTLASARVRATVIGGECGYGELPAAG